MKKMLLFTILVIAIQNFTIAQTINSFANKSIIQDTAIKNSFPIPGSHLLVEKEQRVRDYLEQHPDVNRLAKTRSVEWGFTVGSTHEWWADYFEDQDGGDEQYLVPSTCRAVGTNCYIFVEDTAWGTDRVDQGAVDAIVEAFDSVTPSDAPNNDGIFNVDTRVFGDPPDVDNDPKIIILILDILDGWAPGEGYVAGYFYSLNEIADVATDGQRSNEAEIFYMDSNPADLITDRTDVLNTTAHEFQHMIHWANDGNEMTFINEGLSEIASYICGYGLRSNGLYTQNTNRNLLVWDYDDTLPDYARAAFWTLYLYEQYQNTTLIRDFVDNSHSEWAAIDGTLRGANNARGFYNVFEEWLIANYANGSSGDSKYSYEYSPLSKPAPVATHIGNNGEGSGTIVPFGAEYITFTGGDDLDITFTFEPPLQVRALNIGSLKIDNLTSGVLYSPAEYGTTYPEITFLVYNQSPGAEKDYSYIATGTEVTGSFELAYEDGVAEGAFEWTTDDSIAVWFDGVNGAKLDSIKTFYSGTGRILVDISKLDGNNFLRGSNLFGPSFVIVNDNSIWNVLDLTAENIDASEDFIVSYLIGSDPNNPTISVSDETDTGVYHSRTYTENNGTTQWWIFTSAGPPAGVWNYLIRAYVSVGGGTVAIDQNGIVTIPDEFSIEQNYPNPFNPSTTFKFSTPKDGLVKFTVHDLLGRMVYSENRDLFAGNYSFTWEGNNHLDQQVVSGVYFLRMEAEGFSQTRKMLMMK